MRLSDIDNAPTDIPRPVPQATEAEAVWVLVADLLDQGDIAIAFDIARAEFRAHPELWIPHRPWTYRLHVLVRLGGMLKPGLAKGTP